MSFNQNVIYKIKFEKCFGWKLVSMRPREKVLNKILVNGNKQADRHLDSRMGGGVAAE